MVIVVLFIVIHTYGNKHPSIYFRYKYIIGIRQLACERPSWKIIFVVHMHFLVGLSSNITDTFPTLGKCSSKAIAINLSYPKLICLRALILEKAFVTELIPPLFPVPKSKTIVQQSTLLLDGRKRGGYQVRIYGSPPH